MAENVIKCIILKTSSDELLLPNASVAEIVPIKNIINVANKPGWMLGYLDWRGNSVPLISFESMGGVRMPSLATGNVKAAVIYAVGGDREFPYMSILMQGSPSVINLKEADLVESAEDVTHPAVEDKVKMSDGTYSVMNFEKLEKIIKDIM